MKYDSHVHIGLFKNKNHTFYFEPKKVIDDLSSSGITHAVVMSTTQNSGLSFFSDVLDEFKQLENSKITIFPTLWCLPEMIKDFSSYIEAYNWKALKIHALSQKWKNEDIEKLFCLSAQYHLPIIVHTGFSEHTKCQRFETFIKTFSKVNIILAHAQPMKYAIQLLAKYSNCFIDTAFLPTSQLHTLLKEVNNGKVLYGSDYPIQYAHPDTKILLREIDISKELFGKYINNNQLFSHVFDSKEGIK